MTWEQPKCILTQIHHVSKNADIPTTQGPVVIINSQAQ